MEKKQKPVSQKMTSLRLQTETLRQLDDAKLREVAGGARMWRPGFADDTTPVYDDTSD